MDKLTFKLLITLIILFISSKSFSFTLNNSVGAVFEEDEVKVNIADASCNTALNLSAQELLEIARDAGELYWNNHPTSRLKIVAGSVTTTTAAFQTEAICQAGTSCVPNTNLLVGSDILVSCNTLADTSVNGNFRTDGVLAVTVPNNIDDENIKGSLILINARAGNQYKLKSRNEQVAIMAHEIGHAIGLGHSPTNDNLMYYTSIETRQLIGQDDFEGLSHLYPKKQPFGCLSLAWSHRHTPDKILSLLIGVFLIFGLFQVFKRLFRQKYQKIGHNY